jgi:hypothetical protein
MSAQIDNRMPIQMIHNVNLKTLIGLPALRLDSGISAKPCGAMPCSYQRQSTGFPSASQLRMGDLVAHQKSPLSK